MVQAALTNASCMPAQPLSELFECLGAARIAVARSPAQCRGPSWRHHTRQRLPPCSIVSNTFRGPSRPLNVLVSQHCIAAPPQTRARDSQPILAVQVHDHLRRVQRHPLNGDAYNSASGSSTKPNGVIGRGLHQAGQVFTAGRNQPVAAGQQVVKSKSTLHTFGIAPLV